MNILSRKVQWRYLSLLPFSRYCCSQVVRYWWRVRLIVWVFPRDKHCVKGVRIWSYSGPHFSAFGVNTERYSVSLLIQSKCGKMRIRITPNMDTFYAVESQNLQVKSYQEFRYRWWRILIYSQFTCQSIDSFLEARKTLKLVSAIFYQFFCFSSPISSKKLFLFSRYSNFCNYFCSFPHFPDSIGQMEVE